MIEVNRGTRTRMRGEGRGMRENTRMIKEKKIITAKGNEGRKEGKKKRRKKRKLTNRNVVYV